MKSDISYMSNIFDDHSWEFYAGKLQAVKSVLENIGHNVGMLRDLYEGQLATPGSTAHKHIHAGTNIGDTNSR